MRYSLCLRNEMKVDNTMVHIDSIQDTKCGMMW